MASARGSLLFGVYAGLSLWPVLAQSEPLVPQASASAEPMAFAAVSPHTGEQSFGAQLTTKHRTPSISAHYLQYGVGIAAESRVHPGDVCPSTAEAPCILGSGGGLAIRVGYRARSPWYVGGAYEFSRQTSANLLRLAILQQIRAESRYYLEPHQKLSPYLFGGGGMVLYGNEFRTETGGITSFLGVGLEFQLSRTTVVGGSFVYRPLLLRGWTDTAGARRADRFLGFGLAHFTALELTVEIRSPLSRW